MIMTSNAAKFLKSKLSNNLVKSVVKNPNSVDGPWYVAKELANKALKRGEGNLKLRTAENTKKAAKLFIEMKQSGKDLLGLFKKTASKSTGSEKAKSVFNKLAFANLNFNKVMNAFKNQKIHPNTQGTLLNIISKNKGLSRMSHMQPERAVQDAVKTLNTSKPNRGLFISVPMGGKVKKR